MNNVLDYFEFIDFESTFNYDTEYEKKVLESWLEELNNRVEVEE